MIDIKIPDNLKEREVLTRLEKDILREEILLITGSRQSGKTFLLYLLLNFLMSEGVKPSQIFFFDLESLSEVEMLNGFTNFDDFVVFLKAKGADLNQKVYVFIDEVQYLKHPSGFLKYLHDHYKPGLKFIVSGSSSLEIKKKFTDRLTGRASRFDLHPLSFSEYLMFIGEENLLKHRKEFSFPYVLEKGITHSVSQIFTFLGKEYLRHFESFSVFGGYPKVVLEEGEDTKIKILNEIYSWYVRRDIRDLSRIPDVTGFNSLVKLLSFQIGSLVNETELSTSAAISRPTVMNYLFLLENTFVIHLLSPFFTNRRQEIVKMPKVYFEDVGIRNTAINDFRALGERQDAGHLIENTVFCQIFKNLPLLWEIHFWRTERANEVDFILLGEKMHPLPVEVKYSSFKKPQVPGGLQSFIKRYHPDRAVVITRNFWGEDNFNQTRVLFIPAWSL